MKKPHTRSALAAALLALALALALAAGPAAAQSIDLPRPSPLGKVSQMVGLTEISVEYSSPAVKGRTIFGGVVPWDELWRTGANAATKITFGKDVMIGSTRVPAGSYALFTIPGKTTWTVILNKNVNQGGTREYKQDLDLLRLTIAPQAIPKRERLAFIVADFGDDGASIDLEWDKTRLSIPVKLSTSEQAMASIKGLTDGSWRPYNAAARYLLDKKTDLDQALKLVDTSIGLKEDWFNVWTKAQLLAAKGKKADAAKLAERAQQLGARADYFFAADDVKKALADWKKK
jgi:hypothetical protein